MEGKVREWKPELSAQINVTNQSSSVHRLIAISIDLLDPFKFFLTVMGKAPNTAPVRP